jgi:hypothetical protein
MEGSRKGHICMFKTGHISLKLNSAYFPLILHGQHIQRRVQQFFCCCLCICAAGTCLPSRCLATEPLSSRDWGVHTHTDSKVIS